jgi:hypothetical protein
MPLENRSGGRNGWRTAYHTGSPHGSPYPPYPASRTPPATRQQHQRTSRDVMHHVEVQVSGPMRCSTDVRGLQAKCLAERHHCLPMSERPVPCVSMGSCGDRLPPPAQMRTTPRSATTDMRGSSDLLISRLQYASPRHSSFPSDDSA